MGATITATGTPALVSCRMASMRLGGLRRAAPCLRATLRSRLVTEMATLTRSRLAMRARMSRSRTHARRLRDDADGMTGAVEHLQDRPRDAMLALDGLIGIGHGAERDDFGHVARIGQLLLQHFGGVDLGVEPGLEVQPRRMPEIGVGRAAR